MVSEVAKATESCWILIQKNRRRRVSPASLMRSALFGCSEGIKELGSAVYIHLLVCVI